MIVSSNGQVQYLLTGVFPGIIGHHIHFTFRWTIFLTLVNVMLLKWMWNVIDTETNANFKITLCGCYITLLHISDNYNSHNYKKLQYILPVVVEALVSCLHHIDKHSGGSRIL